MKVALNHNIDENLRTEFYKITSKVPGKIYEHLEAALKVYIALPKNLKLMAMSGDEEEVVYCLKLLGAIQEPKGSSEASVQYTNSKSA